ncbi:MAG TPA: TraM recognition domain-containing protein, partial [Planctomycetota bacterium]|nr:TraM recognition domain-containing protein [Planctomycetota bacterium]
NLYRYVLEPVELFHELVERRFKDKLGGANLSKAAQEYQRLVASGQMEKRPELDEILRLVHEVEENGNHYAKMTSSLRPQLGRLTAGVFHEILSPVADSTKKEILTWPSVLSRGQVVYFYLGHLHGEASATALGKMILLDFQSFIGKIYSYQPSTRTRRVLLVVDEAHHMVSKPFTTILAEGRGANIACILATQTVAQFEHTMGSKAFVNEILTNVHAMLHFQSRDPQETREFADLVGKRLMRQVGEAQAYEPGFFGAGLTNIDDFRASYTRSTTWQDADLIPPWLLTKLPKFHYFGLIGGRPVKARIPLLDPPTSTFAEDIIAQGAHA